MSGIDVGSRIFFRRFMSKSGETSSKSSQYGWYHVSVLVFMPFGSLVSCSIEFRLIFMPSLLGMSIDLLMIWLLMH